MIKSNNAVNLNKYFNSFEIKCLSKRFPIKVNGNYLFKNDKPLPLTSKTLITIGTESFYFLQALPQKPEEEEKKEEIEEVAAVNIDNGVNVETKMEVE